MSTPIDQIPSGTGIHVFCPASNQYFPVSGSDNGDGTASILVTMGASVAVPSTGATPAMALSAPGVATTFAQAVQGTANMYPLTSVLAPGSANIGGVTLNPAPGSTSVGTFALAPGGVVGLASGAAVKANVQGGNTTPVVVDGSGVTQPVSIAATVNAALSAGTNLVGAVNVANTPTVSGNVGGRSAEVTANAFLVTPTLAYAPGNVVGGLLTFPGAFLAALTGTVRAVTMTSKSVQSTSQGFKLYLLSQAPTGVYTDRMPLSLLPVDLPYVRDVIALGAADNGLGSSSLWGLGGLGRLMRGPSKNLYGLLVTTTTPVFTTVADLSITVAIAQD